MPFKNPIVGGTALVIPAINSPNYVPGVSGWIIDADGSVELNDAVVRGTVVVGTAGNGMVTITNTLPAELALFYDGYTAISTAYINMDPGQDQSYHYEIAGYDATAGGFIAWNQGWVDTNLVVHEFASQSYFPSTGVSEATFGDVDDGDDSRVLFNTTFVNFNNPSGLVEFDAEIKTFGPVLIGGTVDITGAMDPYVVSWTASGTAPSIGVGGTLNGFYMLVGKMCDFVIVLVGGAATNWGTGAYTFSTPFPSAQVTGFPYGRATLAISAAAVRLSRQAWQNGSQGVALSDEAGTRVTNAVPLALTNGSIIVISGRYPTT